ncbi:MAG: inositol monophosphatase [Proteobacteria bacterium]|nr:inositol monophosphatase [Pseudomonadota bacterium]
MIDVKKIEAIIRHVSATEVMPRFNNLLRSEIREKKPGDFVTVADEASERVFTELLQDALPGSLVVGEEAVSKDISVLDKLKEDKPVWVIDPIDGTYNFSHGRSKFGILIALVQKGVTLYGWAFDAPGNRMAIAQKGEGTFLDGRRMLIDCRATDMKQLVMQGGGAQAWHFDPVRSLFKEVINYRCSLHDFMNFITGAADFLVHVNKVTPWDHAAGCLLAQEAGAYIGLDETGIPYDPTRFGPAFLLAAPNKEWWQKLHPVIYSDLHQT